MRLQKSNWLRRLDLQSRITLILVMVIVPTFLVVTVFENQMTRPLLEKEIQQLGINAGKTLAFEILSERILSHSKSQKVLEKKLQEFSYSSPYITRVDVLTRDPKTGQPQLIASNIEEEGDNPDNAEEPLSKPPTTPIKWMDTLHTEIQKSDEGYRFWEINYPIETRPRDVLAPRKVIGNIRLEVSLRFVDRVLMTFWKITAAAALLSVIALIFSLRYSLRKTLANDALLRRAESQNIALIEKLHEAQRELMNNEKFAVLGQLTASFAHEIGTPLNAIGGHLQLLQENPALPRDSGTRLEIIQSQLVKIENIVKNFLQSTARPVSQRQLTDLNPLIDKTLELVRPRIDGMGVEVNRVLDRKMGPLRVVPTDIEQILVNLINNSLDGLESRARKSTRFKPGLKLMTGTTHKENQVWAWVSIHDNGVGIEEDHLKEVLKPFFTTKPPGQGTGMGLPICRELAKRYGGMLELDSKWGAWTEVTIRLPYDQTQDQIEEPHHS